LWVFSVLIGTVCADEPEKTDFSYEERYPRTYQWNDTDTGTPYLSGRMPYWYEGKIQHPNPHARSFGNAALSSTIPAKKTHKKPHNIAKTPKVILNSAIKTFKKQGKWKS